MEEPLNASQSEANLFDPSDPSLSRKAFLYNDSYGGLPNGWNCFRDQYGRNYYVNFASGVSQFQNPISNLIDKSQHTNPSWPVTPPHIDSCTPYYLWFLGNSVAQREQYYYQEEVTQPVLARPPSDPTTPKYWHNESEKLYKQCDFINQSQIDSLTQRTPDISHTSGFGEALMYVIKTNIILTILTCLMLFTVTGFTYPLMKLWGISSWFPWSKYTSPAQMIAFAVCYGIYFILYVLPTGLLCCFPWLCGLHFGWANWICCNLVSVDVINPMKQRYAGTAALRGEVLDKMDQFQRDLPVLSVIAETYHYPAEDVNYDSTKTNASDYVDYAVVQVDHGAAVDTFKRRSSLSYHSSPNSTYSKSSNDPILSLRSRRLVELNRFRDISVSSQTIGSSVLATSHNLYDVVNVQYTARYEVHPVQVPIMDALLREYYYHNYTNDLHCDVHLQYLLGSQSEFIVSQKSPPLTDIVFTADQGGRSNGKKLYRCCFFAGGIFFWVLLYTGLYLVALAIWKRSTLNLIYHNVKYLHLAPFNLPPDDTEISSGGLIMNSNSTTAASAIAGSSPVSGTSFGTKNKATVELKSDDSSSKRVQYKILDQILFSGPRARSEGQRPHHHLIE